VLTKKCKICNNIYNNVEYDAFEMMFGTKSVHKYIECSKCYCLQIDEIPLDLNRYYPNNYYSFKKTTNYYNNNFKKFLIKKRDKAILFNHGFIGKLLNLIWPVNSLIKILGGLKLNIKTTILDVGSGSGSKLLSIANSGIKINGIDPYIENKVEYEDGLIIEKKKLEDINDKYDIIMFNHVFEHLSNPQEILKKAYSILNKSGYCILRIPIVSSFAWKHYKTNWIQLDAPRHLFLHSNESISYLAKESGFFIKDTIYDSTSFQFIGSELYQKGISFIDGDFSEFNNQFFSNEELAYFRKSAKEVNKKKIGDQAAFILQKR
jgi:2-polyprenyl-3-methyl-5-hydroxy-6-metoxy-1,4-benzoquinol methylase